MTEIIIQQEKQISELNFRLAEAENRIEHQKKFYNEMLKEKASEIAVLRRQSGDEGKLLEQIKKELAEWNYKDGGVVTAVFVLRKLTKLFFRGIPLEPFERKQFFYKQYKKITK
jgi:predicted RNase H-like nuclease (RuvC/YqgF family)